jgi:hypothetical protein
MAVVVETDARFRRYRFMSTSDKSLNANLFTRAIVIRRRAAVADLQITNTSLCFDGDHSEA